MSLCGKKIKHNLKSYTDSLKSKKGGPSGDPDPYREKWVLANTPRFESGRSARLKANAKLELGQWYTIFKTLAPDMEILEHPCKWHPRFLNLNIKNLSSL
jgi:hypothetical protein